MAGCECTRCTMRYRVRRLAVIAGGGVHPIQKRTLPQGAESEQRHYVTSHLRFCGNLQIIDLEHYGWYTSGRRVYSTGGAKWLGVIGMCMEIVSSLA